MKNTEEVKNLKVVAEFLTKALKGKGFEVSYEVENVYWDFGANIRHNTVVARKDDKDSGFQVFYPNELIKIRNKTFSFGDLQKIVNKHVEMYS